MELTKKDTQMAKGMAVLAMVMLHLFCRASDLPYTPLTWCGEIPLIYFLGLFGDLCVPVFCFCSGYAHYLMADSQKKEYVRRIPGKMLRFWCNYGIVVILFSALGLIFDRSGAIPGNWGKFAGNLFVIGMSYNGAWWFVITYLILLALSPLLAVLTKRYNGVGVLICSFGVYFVSYYFRFIRTLDLPGSVVQWVWTQAILFGTSQFGYFIGMVCRKYGLIGTTRVFMQRHRHLQCFVVFILPVVAFLGHCVVQSVFVAPFTACAALAGLFLAQLPSRVKQTFLFLGRHSTNIWLVHMFFYTSLFPGFVFSAKYPILILGLMMALCLASSVVIDYLYQPVLALMDRK